MNPGLMPPPEPPNDPRSLLLNARLGFRAMPPAAGQVATVIDPDVCAMTLPPLPSSVRDLAEATGSLGGIRPPSNVTIGPDGAIYLLDRTDPAVKRFVPCECRFEKVPCLGGEGGGARETRAAAAITIACGNLYVVDTGIERAPAPDPCGHAIDQAVLDARIRRENHRISVFSLNGFPLRGHLRPPATKPAWRPISVAVDSRGQVWAGDAHGRLHRFSPSGRWEQDWPMVPAPAHLAIDCKDRLYVIAPGAVPSIRVLDADARPIANPPSRAEIRLAFPALPFAVDAAGNLSLEPLCAADAVRKVKPDSELLFDPTGRSFERNTGGLPDIYQATGTYRSAPLDSGIAQCVWHRVSMWGTLPAGTLVRVRAFTADEALSAQDLDALAEWHDCAVAEAFDPECQWDCLVRAQPGRYLWLELTFEGTGAATPSIHAIVVEFPRVSLRRYLPAVFGMEPVSADFLDRFLALFDTPLRRIEQQIDQMARLFDPASAPATVKDPRQLDFLTWLGSWIGIALDRNWDVAMRRQLLKRAGALFDRRGTVYGLREQLLLLLGFQGRTPCEIETRACGRCSPAAPNCRPDPEPRPYVLPPVVLEHFRLRRWLRLGHGHLGDEAVVWGERIAGRTQLGANAQAGVTRLDGSPDPERDPFLVHANRFSVFVPARCRENPRMRKALENLVRNEAPADTHGYLQFVEPRFRIGIQSMLGFDAVVAAVPQGVTLGATALGGASILTAAPHAEGGSAIEVGKSRLGTTARLA